MVYQKLVDRDPGLMMALAKIILENVGYSLSLGPSQSVPDAGAVIETAVTNTNDMMMTVADAVHRQMLELKASMVIETTTTTINWN